MILIVVISLVVHCAFYVLIFSQLARYNSKPNDVEPKKTSIVICFKDEEENVENILPSIVNQKVDELILVDDNSSDGTNGLLKKFQSDSVKVLSTNAESNGKKLALNQGIHAARNNTILLTDADCIPTSDQWATHIGNSDAAFVLGYGPMAKVRGWVALFSRFETYLVAMQYLSYALAGMPYMGVGRNMKLDKEVLLTSSKKMKGTHLASGDDDLMINAFADGSNTSICIHPDSFMYSQPKTSLASFLQQKSRHMSTSFYYKPIHKILLGLFSGTQLLFFISLILGVILGTIGVKTVLIILIVKWTIQQSTNYPVMNKLKENDLFWKFPALDVLHFLYLLIMPVYYLFNKNNSNWS